jgi:predicted enzyme related to lactoylglutathione lyase
MTFKLSHITILVRDQDEALEWYTTKLGLEKRADQPMGPEMRWLTVGVPGQPDPEIVLLKPAPCERGEEFYKTLLERIGQGTMWGFTTDDCQKTYEELTARGVEFNKPPEEAPWGIHAEFKDLYGNEFMLVQPRK